MSHLAIIISGHTHLAAFTDPSGAPVSVLDPDSRRETRPNDLAFDSQGYWGGFAAVKASLAGIASSAYAFRADDLRGFGDAVISLQEGNLSAEGALALLLRKAVADARPLGGVIKAVSVAMFCPLPLESRARLSFFLSDVLDVPVVLKEPTSALECYLRASQHDNAGRSQLAVAILRDAVMVGKVHSADLKVITLNEVKGLAVIDSALSMNALGGLSASAWSRYRLWADFVAWYEQQRSTPVGARELFLPYLVDRRLPPGAISFRKAESVAETLFGPLSAAVAGAADAIPPGTDLHIIGEDALRMGIRERLNSVIQQRSLRVPPSRADRLVMALAQHGVDLDAPRCSTARFGLLVRDRPNPEKRMRALLESGVSLPAVGQSRLEVGANGQRRFKCDIAIERDGSSPELLKQLFFEHKGVSQDIRGIDVRFQVDALQNVRVDAVDSQSREPLSFVESRIPSQDGQFVMGPELIARIPLAGV